MTTEQIIEKTELQIFSVQPGQVLEFSIALQRTKEHAISGTHLSITTVPIKFLDSDGKPIDPGLACEQPNVPGLDPMHIETLPDCPVNGDLLEAAVASRFLVAPPDSYQLSVGPLPDAISCLQCELRALDIDWSAVKPKRLKKKIRGIAKSRKSQLKRNLRLSRRSKDAFTLVESFPECQFDAVRKRFKAGGKWKPVIDALGTSDLMEDYWHRMGRLRDQAHWLPRVGFIGSERGYERLAGMSEIFWLREAEYEAQFSALKLDLVVIETANVSGVAADDREWHLAFSNLDGSLPERGRRLVEKARLFEIPVHLWFTAPSTSARLWKDFAASVDRVISEGDCSEWDRLGQAYLAVPRSLEPAACSLASYRKRETDRMLIPTASDVFQYPDFADLAGTQTVYKSLLCEFRYRFNRHALEERLPERPPHIVGELSRRHERDLLQATTIVLLPAISLRSDEELATVAMDAIASGAIPIMFGAPRTDDAILCLLDQVHNASELNELQALYRIHWLRERRWRELMRHLMRDHSWKSADREALLGRDPFPDCFDNPMISVVLISKRPHLIQQCLETFRRQTWKNKELVFVLNIDQLPEEIPDLREHEHIFALPEASNIGECLNRARNFSNGRYWLKMDDDDFYSKNYLEETFNYYRSSQSDVVGRQAVYYYFNESKKIGCLINFIKMCLVFPENGHISGATLSGDKFGDLAPFSPRDRNSADSNWNKRNLSQNRRVFSGDATSMIVYRDADEKNHTWKISGVKSFGNLIDGSLVSRLERSCPPITLTSLVRVSPEWMA